MKKTHWVRFLLAVSMVFALGLSACSDDNGGSSATATTGTGSSSPSEFPAGSTMAEIVSRGSLVIGVKYDVPLFGQLDPLSNRVDGIDIAIGKEIAKALGLEERQIEFVEAISANRIPYLQEERVDLIISTMTINAERKEQIEFSRPYYLAGQSILVLASNNEITDVESLNGRRVCAAQGSTSEKNVMEKAPNAQLLALQTYSTCVSAMKDNRVDAVSTDDIILAGFAAQDNGLKLVGGQFTTEPYGIGIKKGNTDMVEFVNDLLSEMLEDGRWQEIYEQYLGDVDGLPSAEEAKEALPESA